MMGLLEGPKSFKIGLAVLIQYRRATDSHPASQVAAASTALASVAQVKIMFLSTQFLPN